MAIIPPFFFQETSNPPLAFKIISPFQPSGDQPEAIEKLCRGIHKGEKDQILLGVTGSGKTFTIAHVIQKTQKPTLIMAPNKTLAAQLYTEMKEFFPENAVEYFVSYYDYYQPEAYVPRTDTFIEKESSINEQIDRMRHSATRSLLERRDVIIIASVSCIYGIGGVETYSQMTLPLHLHQFIKQQELIRQLVELQYKRNDVAFSRGNFRVRGDTLEIFPAHYEDRAWRVSFWGDEIEKINEIDALTGERFQELSQVRIFANSHYVTPGPTLQQAIKQIQEDLKVRLDQFEKDHKPLETQRLQNRIKFDLEMMAATGSCSGIENYSRYLTGRPPGMPPPTLFEYLPQDALLIVDESHVTVPQIRGMYKGDSSRKQTLSDYGFRLPSCKDNRPLQFDEWDKFRPQTIYVSATPGLWELEKTQGEFVEQIIRPTGLIDPICVVRPCDHQIDDLIAECHETKRQGLRVLVTTLTKKMAETLTEYLNEAGLKGRYMHSDTQTLERVAIIGELRLGVIDILIGINLLREGLDIPECGLVAILDADKEGYLRSKTSLIQTIGRAARNVKGRVILYADTLTKSMTEALLETNRRREKQQVYNTLKGITPESVKKGIPDMMRNEKDTTPPDHRKDSHELTGRKLKIHLTSLEKRMRKAAANLDFEEAAHLRDQLRRLEKKTWDDHT